MAPIWLNRAYNIYITLIMFDRNIALNRIHRKTANFFNRKYAKIIDCLYFNHRA